MQIKKVSVLCILFCTLSLLAAQNPMASGLDAYSRSDWSSALLSFQKAAVDSPRNPEPWYWLVMTHISSGEYSAALEQIHAFEHRFPLNDRTIEMNYQKGRVYYLLGWYEQSMLTLDAYIRGNPEHELVASAWFWIGESLYAVARYEEARAVYYLVVNKYPDAVKREAAHYRLLLIEQSEREDELLRLLKSSHEEALQIIEEYQRREKTYEQALSAYQRRIAEMIRDTRAGELEAQLVEEQSKNADLRERIAVLERIKAEQGETSDGNRNLPSSSVSPAQGTPQESSAEDLRRALEELRIKAETVQNRPGEGGFQ